jgi:hypothetical protein
LLLAVPEDDTKSGKRPEKGSQKAMREERDSRNERPAEDIIAAFDRELEQAHELHRRHTEHVHTTRANDRPIRTERRRRPR